jgi:hypothetical protein
MFAMGDAFTVVPSDSQVLVYWAEGDETPVELRKHWQRMLSNETVEIIIVTPDDKFGLKRVL